MVKAIIDFDKKFEQYTRKWVKQHRETMTVDEMELEMPNLYLEWMEAPADWLEGAAPQHYFDSFNDAAFLMEWLLGYMNAGIGIPSPLMDRIVSLGSAARDHLLGYLEEIQPIPATMEKNDVYMTVLGLLSEIGEDIPVDTLIRLVAKRTKQEDEVADMAADSLLAAGEKVVEPILHTMDTDISKWARISFLDVLSNYPADKRIFQWMTRLFIEMPGQKALIASYLGKYGDQEAIPVLEAQLMDPELHYLDYLEMRNAIEELGGRVDEDRDFSGDSDYESLKRME